MANSCKDCIHIEDVCGCSDHCYCGGILNCAARETISNLKSFPFKNTECKEFKRRLKQ